MSISPLCVAGLLTAIFCRTAVCPVGVAGGLWTSLQAIVFRRAPPSPPPIAYVLDIAQVVPSQKLRIALPSPRTSAGGPLSDGLVTSSPDADPQASQEGDLIGMINRERVLVGELPLDADPMLSVIARAHSEDMCVRGYFDHYAPGPDPSTPMDRYIAALGDRPDYAMVGENIYYRSATDNPLEYAAEAHEAFMNSPGHRANILTGQYDKVGVGIYVNHATGEFWVTEMFLSDTPQAWHAPRARPGIMRLASRVN